jgi:hypothetical protein
MDSQSHCPSKPAPICAGMVHGHLCGIYFTVSMSKGRPAISAPCLSTARVLSFVAGRPCGEGAHCSCKPGSILIVDEVDGVASPPRDLPHAQEEGVGPPLQHRACSVARMTPALYTFWKALADCQHCCSPHTSAGYLQNAPTLKSPHPW